MIEEKKIFESAFKLYQKGELRETEILLKKNLKSFPKNLPSIFLLGTLYAQIQKFQKAKKLLKQAIQIKPDFVEGHNNLGNVFQELKKYQEAISCYQQAIKLNPEYAEAHYNLGKVYQELSRYQEAIVSYQKVIQIDSNYVKAHNNLGRIFQDMGKFSEAKSYYQQAIKLNPEYAEAYSNLGSTFQDLEQYSEAKSYYQQAIKLNPEYAEAHYNLGCVLERFGKMKEALLSYTKAIQYKLNYRKALHNLGRAQLAINDYKNGWIGHELRKGGTQKTYKSFGITDKKIWNGKKFNGSLIVHGEQGIGDEILYSSMFSDLESYHDDLSITTDERLIPIMQRSFPKINFISRNKKILSSKINSSSHILAGSLGRIFRNSLTDFKNNKHSWLAPNPKKCKEFKKRLSYIKKNKLGISWRSSGVRSSERNISLPKLVSIFPKEYFEIINLEYGDVSFERNILEKEEKRNFIYFNDFDYKNDLEDLSALIKSCDLIVTIANATAHLSCAIGIQTWVLVPADSQWYWHSKSKESLWYSKAQLFRQKIRDNWDYVLNTMQEEIILKYKNNNIKKN